MILPSNGGRRGNAGKSVGTKRPLTQKQIWAIRFFLDREGRLRDRALFDLAIDSKLRGCDFVKIKIGLAGPLLCCTSLGKSITSWVVGVWVAALSAFWSRTG